MIFKSKLPGTAPAAGTFQLVATRLHTFVSQYFCSLQKKSLFLQKNFPSMLALLLLGFLVGNVFGTFLNTLRFFFIWDVFIIFVLIGLLEVVNCAVYNTKNCRVFFSSFGPNRNRPAPEGTTGTTFRPSARECFAERSKSRRYVPAKLVVQFINFFKIGLMIGFFVDAFKVGS